MALFIARLSYSRNGLKDLVHVNSKLKYFECERNIRYQGVKQISTACKICKKAQFSPWHHTKIEYFQNAYQLPMYHHSTYSNNCIINIKKSHESHNQKLFYNVYNQVQNIRALSNTQNKPKTSPSKLKQLGIALILGISAGAGEKTSFRIFEQN